MKRCVIGGDADINNYDYIKRYLYNDDFIVFCNSRLKHLDALQMQLGLIVWDFDSAITYTSMWKHRVVLRKG